MVFCHSQVHDYPKGRSVTELEMQLAALVDPKSAMKRAFFHIRDSSFIRYVERGGQG